MQAHKFVGVNDPAARNCVEDIRSAKSPEEAARMGRTMERQCPDLVWLQILVVMMFIGLKLYCSAVQPNMFTVLNMGICHTFLACSFEECPMFTRLIVIHY